MLGLTDRDCLCSTRGPDFLTDLGPDFTQLVTLDRLGNQGDLTIAGLITLSSKMLYRENVNFTISKWPQENVNK